MDASKTKNEKSVELAVRRELAYRNKLAGLGFHPSQYLMPLQVPSSCNPMRSLNPSSQPMPTNNQFQISQPFPNSVSNRPQNPIPNPLRAQHPFPKQNQKCILFPNSNSRTNITFPRTDPKPNLSGTKRKETMGNEQGNQSQKPKPSLSLRDYVTMTPEGYSYCNICDVPCSGQKNLQAHLKGNKHKNKMQLMEWTKKGVSRLFCEICHVCCTDEDGLKMHYDGQKHKTKLQQLEVGEERKEHRICDLCKIWCMNEAGYQQHLKGRKHITRVYKEENR